MSDINHPVWVFSDSVKTIRKLRKQLEKFFCILSCCILLILLLPLNAYPANFSINPVRTFLDGKNKTSVLKIKNNSDTEIALQLRAFAWTQDSRGENMYSPTKDIIFFPRILSVQKDEEKIIRIGTNTFPGKEEKTYRLFMEEIPAPDPVNTTTVKMIMKVGTPIFISPLQPELAGTAASLKMTGGDLRLKVKNEGNVHFIVNSIIAEGIDSSGKELYRTEIGGWYIHGGNAREYVIPVPEEYCQKIQTLKVNISTDKKLSFREQLNVTKEMCTP